MLIRQRTPVLTMLAFVNVLAGAGGLLLTLAVALVQLIELAAPRNDPFAVMTPFNWDPLDHYLNGAVAARQAIALCFTALSFAGYAMLLLAGIGLFYSQRWAWYLTLAFVVLNVLHTFLYLLYQFSVVLPAIHGFTAAKIPVGMRPVFMIDTNQLWWGYALRTLFYCLPVLCPVVLLCLMFLPGVTRGLDGNEAAPPEGWRDVLERERPRHEDYDEDDEDDYDYRRRRRRRRWD
jgi:hypothetical protein